MKAHSPAFLPLALLTPILLAGGHAVEGPRFQPKAGTVLTKEFNNVSELELEDMSLEVNGMDMSDAAGAFEMAMKVTMSLTLVDRYESVEDGRPAKLKRAFEEIASNTHISGTNPAMGAEERDIPLTSELEGSTVLFTWNGSDYGVEFEDEGDGALLENLVEDVDLRGFLPAGEVSEGDTWDVSADAVRAALAPGGDLKLHPEDETNPMNGMNGFSQNEIIGDLQGKFVATYGGTRDEDGTKVAVIKLHIEASSAQDLTQKLESMRDQMESQLPEGVSFDVSAMDAEYEIDAEGELLWNLEAGIAHSLHLSGETRMIMDMSMNISMGEEEQAMDMSQTYSGTQTITLTVGE